MLTKDPSAEVLQRPVNTVQLVMATEDTGAKEAVVVVAAVTESQKEPASLNITPQYWEPVKTFILEDLLEDMRAYPLTTEVSGVGMNLEVTIDD